MLLLASGCSDIQEDWEFNPGEEDKFVDNISSWQECQHACGVQMDTRYFRLAPFLVTLLTVRRGLQ